MYHVSLWSCGARPAGTAAGIGDRAGLSDVLRLSSLHRVSHTRTVNPILPLNKGVSVFAPGSKVSPSRVQVLPKPRADFATYGVPVLPKNTSWHINHICRTSFTVP